MNGVEETLTLYTGLLALFTLLLFGHWIWNNRHTPQLTEEPEPVEYNNLVIKSGYNNPYTEIDRLIVSQYGIFCIEEKAWKGYIFGNTRGSSWVQRKFNEAPVKLYNPLHQNYGHIKSLERLLGNKLKADIHSYIVFTGATKVFTTQDNVLTGWDELENAVRSHTNKVYSTEEFKDICAILDIESAQSAARLDYHIMSLQHA